MTEAAAKPSFLKEDFVTGTAPYEYLYGIENDFEQKREKERLAEMALGLGVKTFKSFWSSYLNTQRATAQKRLGSTVTEFSGQEMELSCGEYLCTDLGVYIIYGEPRGCVTVCPHPIMPVRRIINIDTGETQTEIAFRRGNRWKKILVEKGVLASAQKIVGLASKDISVTSENAREMVKYLAYLESENYDLIPEVKSVGHLGWVPDYGFSPYVDDLIFDGDETYRRAFNAVQCHGSREKWMEMAREARAHGSVVMRILLAASFASALIEPLNVLPFLVHVWGGSGAGKTVGLRIAASVWANPELGKYVKTFHSTPAAMEKNAAFCGSMPFCLDELGLKGKQRDHDFDDLIYALCEGAGKNRASKAGGLQSVPTWNCCTLSNGEFNIVSGNSAMGAVNRVIELNCQDARLMPDLTAAYKIAAANYGFAGREFVEAIREAREGLTTEVLKSTQESIAQELEGKGTDKQILAASTILAADTAATLLLFKDGYMLEPRDIAPFLITQDAANANKRAYDWLLDTISANPIHFSTTSQAELWGVVEDDWAYINKSVFDRLMRDEGFSPQAFLDWAKRSRLLKSNEGRSTICKRISGVPGNPRCVCLKMQKETEEQPENQNVSACIQEGFIVVDTNPFEETQ